MRKYTLLVSVLCHAGAIGAVIVAPIVATDVLPQPRRHAVYVQAVPEAPPEVAPVRMRSRSPALALSRRAAPVEAPAEVQPEPLVDRVFDAFGGADAPLFHGPVPGEAASGGEPILPPPPPPDPEPVRVGGEISPPRKLIHVAPAYPEIARAARVEGIVILEAVVAVDGTVQDVRVLRSVPMLDRAAVDAVRQWRFTPTLLNRQPVPVVMTVTVGFRLN